MINLADSSADSDKRYELQKALNSWIIETGDMGLTPESQIIGEFWPEGLQPRTGNVSYRIENQQVILTSKTKGASIGYQVLPLDSLPTGSWELYSRAIPIRAETRVAALAQRIGYSASDTLMIEFR